MVTRPPTPATPADIRLAGLSLWVHGRQFPDCSDYWDGNWLVVTAQVEAPGAFVRVSGPVLRNTEIAGFADDLRRLCETLEGSAQLTPLEPDLEVSVEATGLGHLAVAVTITPDHLTQTHTCRFELDQSHLPAFLAACEEVTARFPVVGEP